MSDQPQESHKLAEELERRSSVLALGTIVRDNRAIILAALRSSEQELENIRASHKWCVDLARTVIVTEDRRAIEWYMRNLVDELQKAWQEIEALRSSPSEQDARFEWMLHNGGLLNEWAAKEWRPDVHGPLIPWLRSKALAAIAASGERRRMGMADTLCWHCDKSYPMARLFCTHCHYPNANHNLDAAQAVRALEDRIETLVAEVDSWKASYVALAPDHDIAMMRANSRIEALTKALRELVECKDLKERFEKLPHERQEQHGHPRSWCDHCALQYEYEDRKPLAWAEARKLLASAAGAEGMTPLGAGARGME